MSKLKLNPQEYFQDLVATLNNFWSEKGCVILSPYDMEMGAGTFHPATALLPLSPKPIYAAYVQPSRRPTDGRYGENPNRFYKFHQYQVLLKPSPDDIIDLYLESLNSIGINTKEHDIRFVEDDWESPTLGAWGLGWEVWCDGMEITQFTFMQQIGGIDCKPVTGEITYGLERVAMYLQNKDHFLDLQYNNPNNGYGYTFKDLNYLYEQEMTAFCLDEADTDLLRRHFNDAETEANRLIAKRLVMPAYEQCIKASNCFNLLDARGVISTSDRASYISKVRGIAKQCAELYVQKTSLES